MHGIRTDRLNNQLKISNTELMETRGGLLNSQAKLKTALDRVTESRDESRQAQNRLRELLYAADLRAAGRAYNEGDCREVIRLLNQQFPGKGEIDLRGPEWHLLNRLVAPPHIPLEGHVGDVYSVKFSRNGRWLASGGADTTLHIYHAKSLALHAKIWTGLAPVRGVAFDPSGEALAAACFDGNVHVYDVASKQKRLTLSAHSHQAWDVAWTPDGESLVTCGKDEWVRLWDPQTGKPLAKIGPHLTGKAVRRLAISRDGRWLATACNRRYAMWDLKTRKAIISNDDGTRVTSVAFSPDSQRNAFGALTGRVYQASWGPKPIVFPIYEHDDAVEAVAFSPDGNFLASVDRGGVLSTSRLDRDPLESTIRKTGYHKVVAHKGRALTVAFSPDSRRVVTAGQDGTLRVWKMDDLDQPRSLSLPHKLGRAHYLQDQSILASHDDRVVRWHPQAKTQKDVITHLDCTSFAVSPESKRFVAGTMEGKLYVYDFAAAKILKETQFLNLGMIADLAYTADGSKLIAFSDQELLILHPDTLEKHEGLGKIRCNSMAVSPDGKTLAVSRKNLDNIELWDLETFQQIKTFPGHVAVVNSLRFSRDGQWIASGSEDRLIKIWRVEDAKLIWTLRGHRGRVFGVDFSADGKTLFSSGADGTLRIWSMSLGQELLTLNANQEIPFRREHYVTVSPDGTALVYNRLGILSYYQLSAKQDRGR